MKNLNTLIIIICASSNMALAQLVAVNDSFSVPSTAILTVEPGGLLENDSFDGETNVDGMVTTLITNVNNGLLECVVRNGDDIISRTPGICSDGSFDYTASNSFKGFDSFVYQVTYLNEPPVIADVNLSACTSGPQVYLCWKEIPYVEKLTELGYNIFLEGFDGSAWESIHNSTAASIVSKNITWKTNFPQINDITTASGSPLSGGWSGYDSNHGHADGTPGVCDVEFPPQNCFPYDGLSGNSPFLLFGVGAYVASPIPDSANISFSLNGNTTHNIGKMSDHGYDFFGIIDTNGFTDFSLIEIDGKIGQENFIFMDNFILATLNPVAKNTPPSFSPVNDIILQENQHFLLDIMASDQDDGDSLFFHATSQLPDGANFDDNFDGTAGFSWRPNNSHIGNIYTLDFEVTDNGFPALSDAISFQITVEENPETDLIFKNGFENN